MSSASTETTDTIDGSSAVFRTSSNEATRQLFAAVSAKDELQLRQLLSSPERPSLGLDDLNEEGHTCLGMSCMAGSIEIIPLLLKNGANPSKIDFYGQPPLQYAIEYGHVEVVSLLIQSGADVNYIEERLSALHVASLKGRMEIVRMLIDAHCDVNARNRKGVTPLHCAVANGHGSIVQLLLEAHAHPNVKGQMSDRTPLFMAGEIGDGEIVRMLLSHGAKLNLTDQYGMTPLNLVCNRNNSEIAQLFIRAGARIDIADGSGNLPLHYAARSGDSVVVRLLLENESKVDVLNSNAESPLHLAIRMQHTAIVEQLVRHGCSTNIYESPTGVTPLFAAVTSYSDPADFEELLLLLTEGDCSLDLESMSTSTSSSTTTVHETPIYRALDLGKADIAEVLLRHGADPYLECPYDMTIMSKACQRRMTSFVELMMSTSYRWRHERWLNTDFNPTCIASRNLGRFAFAELPKEMPMIFWNKVTLYHRIQEVLMTPFSLQQWCRVVIRTSVGNRRMFHRIHQLQLPKRLIDFLLYNS